MKKLLTTGGRLVDILDVVLTIASSDDSIYRKYRYIVFDIDISYRILSSKKYQIFRYIAISFIYRDILGQKFIFLLLHYQNNENKRRKGQTNRNKLITAS